MIKGSLLTGLRQRKRFASHEAGELHRIGELLLSAFICSPENQNVSLLTLYYCKISALHPQQTQLCVRAHVYVCID